MAEIRIEESPVTRIFHEGRGAEVTESWKGRDGADQSRRYTCWFDAPHGLTEGDVVTVVGVLGVKVDEWTDRQQETRHTAKVSVNQAKVVGWPVTGAAHSDETVPPGGPVSPEPQFDAYTDAETPF